VQFGIKGDTGPLLVIFVNDKNRGEYDLQTLAHHSQSGDELKGDTEASYEAGVKTVQKSKHRSNENKT
jgi:hypothetical protein